MSTLMMTQCGLRLVADCDSPRLERLLVEAAAGSWRPWDGGVPDVHVAVSSRATPFDVAGWQPLTRGCYHRDGAVMLLNACGSGFDVVTRVVGARTEVEVRHRPPMRERAAAIALPWRFHLLARSVLLQYPAIWATGLTGSAPLHAAAVTVAGAVPLLVGPGGTGRSTLLLAELRAGESACTDNLSVSDGLDVYGLVEPMRVEGSAGRRMPHGRRECELPGRVDVLRPDHLVVLRRGTESRHRVRTIDPTQAARVLAAGTHMAGELRRYWAYAATLALGTGRGPAVPDVATVAHLLAERLPAVEVTLGTQRSPALAQLLAAVSAAGS